MAYKNSFHRILTELNVDDIWILQVVHELHGLMLSELCDVLPQIEIQVARSCLERLQSFGLVCSGPSGEWICTWSGAGVDNWRTQIQLADPTQRLSEPRLDENGEHLSPFCSEYRPTLFAPGFCWCCRPRHLHASEIIRAAERLLSQGWKR